MFCDPLACIFDDEWHSTDEPREIIVGHSFADRLLLVCFTARPNRFAEGIAEGSLVVVLEPQLAQVFKTPERVKAILEAIAQAMPPLTPLISYCVLLIFAVY